MKKKTLLISPALLLLLLFALAPLMIMLYYSFTSDSGAPGLTFENYIRFFSKPFYMQLTWHTIALSLTVTAICLCLAYPLAYIMAKHLKGSRNIILFLIIIPFFTSQLVRVYSWLSFLRDGGIFESFLKGIGLLNGDLGILFTDAAVIIGLVHIFFPYMVITIYMSLESIDDSLIEASGSLGAAWLSTFRRVILPLSRSGIVSGCILVFVPCLGSFVEPRILGGVNGSVIGTVIEDQFFEIYGWNFGAAIAFLLLALVLISIGLLNRLGGKEDG